MKKYFLLAVLLGFMGQACETRAMDDISSFEVQVTQGGAPAREQTAPEGILGKGDSYKNPSPAFIFSLLEGKPSDELKKVLQKYEIKELKLDNNDKNRAFLAQKGKSDFFVPYTILKKDNKWDFVGGSSGAKEILKQLQGKK